MNVLIADDHALFRQGLRLVLAEFDENVEAVEAANFTDALARAGDSGPFDLALVDLTMPGMPSFEGIAALTARLPGVPVVVLSASERPDDVAGAIEAGARGYVVKSARPRVLYHALPLILAGEIYVPPVVLNGERENGAEDRAAAAARAEAVRAEAGLIERLTPRERDVLGHLAAGLSNKEIAQALDIDEGTVKAHIKALLRKLDVANRTQAAILAVRNGWVSADGG